MANAHRSIPSLTPQDKERFWVKVDVRGPDECWEWRASRSNRGYGKFGLNRQSFRAHRVAWTVINGPIPQNLGVLHHCDNPPCCNPRHLFLGTQADNAQDRVQKSRCNHPRGDEHWTHRHPEQVLRGEKAGRSKLVTNEVLSIRERAANGESRRSLARRFGVSKGTVDFIVCRKNWAHVG